MTVLAIQGKEVSKMRRTECLTVSVPELATMLGVSPEMLYGQIRYGRLEAIRVGARVVIPIRVAERMLGQKIRRW